MKSRKVISAIVVLCLIITDILTGFPAQIYSNIPYFIAPPGSGDLINHSLNADLNVKGKQTLAIIDKIISFLAQRDKLPKKADLIMVLGSDDMRVPLAAAKLFKEGFAERILVSGCSWKLLKGKVTPEAHIYRDILVRGGIPEEAIIIEDESTSTLENIVFSKKILKNEGIPHDTVILIQFPVGQRTAGETFKKQFGRKPLNFAPYIPDTAHMSEKELLNIAKIAYMHLWKLTVNGPSSIEKIGVIKIPSDIAETREKLRNNLITMEMKDIIKSGNSDLRLAEAEAMIRVQLTEQGIPWKAKLITNDDIRRVVDIAASGEIFTVTVIPERMDIKNQRKKHISLPISVIENRERRKLDVYKIPSDKLNPETIRLIRDEILDEAMDFHDSGANMLHIDIRDDEFIEKFIKKTEKERSDVPGSNTALITPGFLKQLSKDVILKKDIHLLCCEKPNGIISEDYLKALAQLDSVRSISLQICAFNVKTLIKHLEDIHRLGIGIKAGIVLELDETVESLTDELLGKVDMIVLTVVPTGAIGYSPTTVDFFKVREKSDMLQNERKFKGEIQIQGGIDDKSISLVSKGADVFVSGSYVTRFDKGSPERRKTIHGLIEKAVMGEESSSFDTAFGGELNRNKLLLPNSTLQGAKQLYESY